MLKLKDVLNAINADRVIIRQYDREPPMIDGRPLYVASRAAERSILKCPVTGIEPIAPRAVEISIDAYTK